MYVEKGERSSYMEFPTPLHLSALINNTDIRNTVPNTLRNSKMMWTLFLSENA